MRVEVCGPDLLRLDRRSPLNPFIVAESFELYYNGPMSNTPLAFPTLAVFVSFVPLLHADDVLSTSTALSQDDVQAGWISLFDGQSTFGWRDAGDVENGLLVGCESTLQLANYELRLQVKSPGRLEAGGKSYLVEQAGMHEMEVTGPVGALRLREGLQLGAVAVRPVGLQPLFNGIDLAAWKAVPRPSVPADRQPRWFVRDGAIHVEGGPGALEYAGGTFADMVMQISVRADVAHANSGIFLRNVPGTCLQGYEVQIWNKTDNRWQPSYYTTGAIDDRQLARRVVSHDLQWSVVTIVTRGPHIATWVEGVQMVDWTDHRAPAENPRLGLRVEPGTIQFQAHDPETKVRFRDIRVGRLGEEK